MSVVAFNRVKPDYVYPRGPMQTDPNEYPFDRAMCMVCNSTVDILQECPSSIFEAPEVYECNRISVLWVEISALLEGNMNQNCQIYQVAFVACHLQL